MKTTVTFCVSAVVMPLGMFQIVPNTKAMLKYHGAFLRF